MPEHADHSLSRRGAWIGLRTLRQRPKVVDHMDNGDPIFEVRSVRLVLRADADHFNRLENCSKCGRQVPGAAVHELADIDRPSNPLICTSCVRAVAKTSSLRPSPRRAEPESGKDGTQTVDAPSEPEVDDGRLSTLEGQYEGMVTRLTELADVQRSESIEGRAVEDLAGARFDATLAEVREALAASSEAAAAQARSLEQNVHQSLHGFGELLRAQQSELAALTSSVVETRTELIGVTESHRELARAQHALEERLAEIAARAPSAAPDAELVEARLAGAIERKIDELDTGLARSLEAQRSELRAFLDEGLAQARAEVTGVEERLRENLVALAQLVERQGSDFESTLDNDVRAQLTGVAQAVGDLRSASSAGANRLHALEQRLEEAMDRLAALGEAHERDARAAAARWAAQASTSETVGGDLVEGLEWQLQQAEGRLSRLAVPSGGGPD